MRRIAKALSALCVSVAFVGAASAADIRPAYKAPPPPPPMWSWTGFYIGAQLGAGLGPVEWQQNVNLAAVGLVGVPPIFSTGSHTVSGAFGGGVIGLNWQAGWVVFGVEADANWGDIKGTSNCGLLALWNCRTKVDSFGTVTARVGAAVDRALIYVKGGAAWAHNKYDLNLLGLTLAIPGVGTVVQPSSLEETHWGWVIGTGIEYALPGNWSAKIEYNYMDFGTKDLTFNTVPITALIPGGAGLLDRFSITERIHTIKFGVNYRFGWGAPLYARY
jgi:outer membrane immunogenic protein